MGSLGQVDHAHYDMLIGFTQHPCHHLQAASLEGELQSLRCAMFQYIVIDPFQDDLVDIRGKPIVALGIVRAAIE